MSSTILFRRGTQAQLDAAAGSGLLNPGEPYFITDAQRIAVGLTVSTYQLFAKLSEAGGGGAVGASPTVFNYDFGTVPVVSRRDIIYPAVHNQTIPNEALVVIEPNISQAFGDDEYEWNSIRTHVTAIGGNSLLVDFHSLMGSIVGVYSFKITVRS